jgi:hydrogenase maturation protease
VTLGLGHDKNECRPARTGVSAAARILPVKPPTLVLGFGNVLLSDDGAGVQLVERLRSELGQNAAEFIDGGTLSFSLLTYVEAADSMLVIDAADLNCAPGTIRLFEGAAMDEFLKGARRRTVHEVGLIDLLDMARLQDCLPSQRALLCIQPGRIDWCETLSAAVAEVLPGAAGLARATLRRWKLA